MKIFSFLKLKFEKNPLQSWGWVESASPKPGHILYKIKMFSMLLFSICCTMVLSNKRRGKDKSLKIQKI